MIFSSLKVFLEKRNNYFIIFSCTIKSFAVKIYAKYFSYKTEIF